MSGHDVLGLRGMVIDRDIDLTVWPNSLDAPKWHHETDHDIAIDRYHADNQRRWMMPTSYQELDIAEYVLSLCDTQVQLQRVGEELLMFQDRGLFDLLRYLKYLVDLMRQHGIIWGVGRGSSVASYVLYLLGVHRIDSMFYDLDPHEFLR